MREGKLRDGYHKKERKKVADASFFSKYKDKKWVVSEKQCTECLNFSTLVMRCDFDHFDWDFGGVSVEVLFALGLLVKAGI